MKVYLIFWLSDLIPVGQVNEKAVPVVGVDAINETETSLTTRRYDNLTKKLDHFTNIFYYKTVHLIKTVIS